MKLSSENKFPTEKGNGIQIEGTVYFGGVYGDSCEMTIETPVRIGNLTRLAAKNIGAFSYFNGKTSMACVHSLGRFCSIAENVVCGMPEHPIKSISSSPVFSTFNTKAYYNGFHHLYDDENWFRQEIKQVAELFPEKRKERVEIGNDVWIGYNVFIQRGVKIGDGAVIAAGAVVTKDVPPYAIVAGVPAKVIKLRFSEEIVARLCKLQWWKYGPDVMQNIHFADIEVAVEELEERIYVQGFPVYEPEKYVINPIKEQITKLG